MYGDFAGMYDPLMKDVDYDSWRNTCSVFWALKSCG